MTGGFPRRAMAVESFLLFPPLYVPAGLSAYWVSSNLLSAHSTTWKGKGKGHVL